ncbi:MAG: hypothetical protein ACREC9_05080 [Methylocella sp.]
MLPPLDGSRNSISVSGRTYSSLPQMVIAVPTADVPVLQANGWQTVPPVNVSGEPGESWAGRLRRLRGAAVNNNPVERPILIGSIPWVAGGVFAAGAIVGNAGNVYKTVAGGTAGATAPTHITGAVSDGAVTWTWQGVQTAPGMTAVTSTHNAGLAKTYAALGNTANNTGVFRFGGGVPAAQFGSIAMISVTNAPQFDNWITGTTVYNFCETSFNGVKLEYSFLNFVGTVSIQVDGQYIDSVASLGGGGVAYFTLDFTNVAGHTSSQALVGRQRHVITAEWNGVIASAGEVGLYQVSCEPTATCSYPFRADDFSTAYIADSQGFGEGDASVNANRTLAHPVVFRHLMGLPDIALCAIPGSGYVAPGVGTPFGSHAIGDLRKLNAYRSLKYIIVQASGNDQLYLTTLQNAAFVFHTALRAAFPLLPIFVTGVINGSVADGVTLAVAQAIERLVAAAVAQNQANGDGLIYFIPNSTAVPAPWIVGTGHIGAPVGDGNADFDIGVDGTHLSPSGHNLQARNLATGILSAIASIP